MEEGREVPGRVEPLRREIGPALVLEDQAVDLVVPVDLQLLALGVVVSAGEAHEGRGRAVGRHLLDQPAAGANEDEFPWLRRSLRQAHGGTATTGRGGPGGSPWRAPVGFEGGLERLVRAPGIDGVAAGEDVDGGVEVLGPGVDGEVALLDRHGAGDAAGREAVEVGVHDGGADLRGRGQQAPADVLDVVQQAPGATVEIDQEMAAEGARGGAGGWGAGRTHRGRPRLFGSGPGSGVRRPRRRACWRPRTRRPPADRPRCGASPASAERPG